MQEVLWNKTFSHIYVEKNILHHPKTKEILSHFPCCEIIEIENYKEIFNRKHQSNSFQYHAQSLILAHKSQGFVYKGSPVCQSFHEEYFYYCSNVMNCVYDCEYCFLKGMYGSSNIVVFVNLEDYFLEIESLLKEHPVYVCASYDTDLFTLEPYLGIARQWGEFAIKHPDFLLEIRTKGTNIKNIEVLPKKENCIIACTISSEYVQQHYESRTPTVLQRIKLLQELIEDGYSVRLCFDPILPIGDWKKEYKELIEVVVGSIDINKVRDISVGTFRLSKEYLKTMRQQYPLSSLLQYPYVCDNGFYHLPKEQEVESYFIKLLENNGIQKEKIFVWKE